MAVVITCVRGADVRRRLTLRTFDGNGDLVPASYTGTPLLAARVWPGDNRAVTFSPTLAWVDATVGTVAYSHTAAQTTAVEPGEYRLLVEVTTADGLDRFLVGDVDIQGSPGTDAAPRAYAGEDDLYALAPWAGDLLSRSDQTNFVEQLASASRWLDEQVVARAGLALEDQRGRHGAVAEVDPLVPPSGVDLGPAWGRSALPDTTLEANLAAIQARLDADGLVVDSRARRVVARYALYLLLEPQLGDKDGTPYQSLAMRQRATAIRELAGWVARILDADAATAYVVEG
jgi:hypothetical protein